jgi:hypothetical protein
LSSGALNAHDGDFIGVGDVASSANEPNAQQIVTGPGHFTGIRGYVNSTASKTVTFTLRINGLDSTLSCTIAASTAKTCSTTGASVAFSDGDLITIRVNTTVTAGHAASAAITVGP